MRKHTYVFVDVEATLIRGKQYIIEIGAVKWRPDGTKESFSQLIQPYKFKRLNSHIQKLTGITTEQLLCAAPFKEVMRKFVKWCGDEKVLITFGEFDRRVFEDELRRNYMDLHCIYPMIDFQQKYMIANDIKEQPGLGKLLETFNITVDTQHRALADAESLSLVFEAASGEMLIEQQQTNQLLILLSEFRQLDEAFELSITSVTGKIDNDSVKIEKINEINRHLTYDVYEEKKVNGNGEVEIMQRTVIHPSNEIEMFLKQIVQDLSNKVLITRSGLKQLSRVHRMHHCVMPKTEVMTLQSLLKHDEDLEHFTLNGRTIQTFKVELPTSIKKYEDYIVQEFKKRNLFTKELIATVSE